VGPWPMNFASLQRRALKRIGFDWRLGATNPTVDLYFREPLADLIAVAPRSGKPIRQIGPNLFVCHATAVLVRYAKPFELNFILRRSFERVFYVLDDRLSGIEADESLPAPYRQRLAEFSANYLPTILSLATNLIVPNAAVAAGLWDYPIEILEPASAGVCENFSHFDLDQTGAIHVLLSGSRSHTGDIEMIAPGIVRALKKNHRLRVTSFLGDNAPRLLRNHAHVRNRPQLPWQHFRRFLRSKRFHIATAPYRNTPFNAARSISKILDHGAIGAAGLYSNRAPHNRYVGHDYTGFLMSDDAYDWSEAVLELAGRFDKMRRIATNGAALARELGDHQRVREFWLNRLF
jgi:hypothetical protein